MIARTVYFMLKNQVDYVRISSKSFEKRYRKQQIRYLHRKAAKLGFLLTPIGSSP